MAWPHTHLEDGRCEIEPLFIDRPGSADPSDTDPAIEIDEGTEVLAVVRVQVKHVALEKVMVVVRLQPPIVIDDCKRRSKNRPVAAA